MMGTSDPQRSLFDNLSLEEFVPEDHPLRRVRPLIDDAEIRRVCQPLYSPIGRPSIPPEQLCLASIGGDLMGVPSERKLVMELQCHMALRWLVGLGLEQDDWDASTFSQNRRRRFDESGVLEKLFDSTVKRGLKEGLISRHLSADGTLVRANASYKSFVPIELAMDPDEYKRRLRVQDEKARREGDPPDPGNRAVAFRGERRSNNTHRSITDPDCRFASKGTTGTGAVPRYTVNALIENRNRFLLGIGVEIFRSSASETEGCQQLLKRVRRRLRFKAKTVGADTGSVVEGMLGYLPGRKIESHIAVDRRGKRKAHARVRMRRRGRGYELSQRCRKKIEELFGEA